MLKKELADLNLQIETLRASYEEEKLKSRKLEVELAQAYRSVDERSKLEEHVINIGLSNNYFKNIAEVFKKRLSDRQSYSFNLCSSKSKFSKPSSQGTLTKVPKPQLRFPLAARRNKLDTKKTMELRHCGKRLCFLRNRTRCLLLKSMTTTQKRLAL